MRVPVKHPGCVRSLKVARDGIAADIARIVLQFVSFALFAHRPRDGQSLVKRTGEKGLLPGWRSNFSTKSLIVVIVNAPCVAVGEQHLSAEQIDHSRILQEFSVTAGRPCSGRPVALDHTEQKITIATHQQHTYASRGESAQAVAQLRGNLIRLVIAHPRLKNVTQQKQVRDCPGVRGEGRKKQFSRLRVVITQVHV